MNGYLIATFLQCGVFYETNFSRTHKIRSNKYMWIPTWMLHGWLKSFDVGSWNHDLCVKAIEFMNLDSSRNWIKPICYLVKKNTKFVGSSLKLVKLTKTGKITLSYPSYYNVCHLIFCPHLIKEFHFLLHYWNQNFRDTFVCDVLKYIRHLT